MFDAQTASLIIYFAGGNASNSCDGEPEEFVIKLPQTCTDIVTGKTKVNVGRCNDIPCTTRSSSVSRDKCCLPSETTPVEVQCNGTSYKINQVTSCACAECANDDRVMVNGAVKAGGAATNTAYVIKDGIRNNVVDGQFSFETVPQAGRIVFQVQSDTFMPQLVTLDVVEGVTERYVEVSLTPKGIPHVVDAGTGAQHDVVTPGMSSAVSVRIPPNSFQDKNGNAVSGDVDVFLTFSDPRLPDGISSAPGQFTYEDAEGDRQALETRGVVTLKAQYQNGDEVFVSGKVTLKFDADALAIASGESFSLWNIDGATGKWKKSGDLTSASSRRRRRQVTPTNGTVEGETEIPLDAPYLNCDRSVLRGRACSIDVHVYYGGDWYTPLAGEHVTAYILEYGLFIGSTGGVTDKNGKACLLVLCGLEHIVVLKSNDGVLVHQTHNLPTGFDFTNRADGFTFVAPTSSSANGPVFPFNGLWGTCAPHTSTAYRFKLALPQVRPALYGSLNAVEIRTGYSNSWFPNPPSQREVCAVQVEIRVHAF